MLAKIAIFSWLLFMDGYNKREGELLYELVIVCLKFFAELKT